MAARSAMIGSPAISLPRIMGRLPLASAKSSDSASSLNATVWRSALGSSIPITVLPGIGDTRALIADMLRAISSARPTTRLALMPGAGSSSYMVTTGPARTATISPLTLKSSSTFSSRRAFRSSAILSSFATFCSPGSASRSRLGRSYSANMSRWRGLAAGSARRGADVGSEISGARRGEAGSSASGSAASSARARRSLRRGRGRISLSAILSAMRGARRRNSGRVRNCTQSIAKTRVTSAAPPNNATIPASAMIQPDAPSGKRPATASIPPAPSRPASPPNPAGSPLALPSNTSASTVASRTMAASSMAKGRHQRPSSAELSVSIPRHNRRAEI